MQLSSRHTSNNLFFLQILTTKINVGNALRNVAEYKLVLGQIKVTLTFSIRYI